MKRTNKQKVLGWLSREFISISDIARETHLSEEQVLSAIRNLQYLDNIPVSIITESVKGCRLIRK